MKRIINITIGKTVFLIEDDAYQKLDKYLSDIRRYFSSDEGSEDIYNDIEYSIAEKLTAKGLDLNKSISKEDVEKIIEEMGTIEELSGESDKESKNKNISEKRLYRDTEDVVIAGVASGIARYFDIDPTIVRILFVISIFLGGFGVLTYLILWIIVPPADTASKKINMEGGVVTLSEIETFVKKKIDEIPKNSWKRIFSFPFKIIKKLFGIIKILVVKFGLVLSILIGVIFIVVSFAIIFGFSTAIITLLLGGSFSEPTILGIVGLLPQGFIGIIFFISFYLSIIIPILALFFVGISLVKRKRTTNRLGAPTLFIVWFISIIIVTGVLLARINEIQAEIKETQKHIRDSYSEKVYTDLTFNSIEIGGRTDVRIVKGDEYKVEIKGSERTLNALRISDNNKILDIDRANQIDVCILFCSDLYSAMIVNITTPELEDLSFTGSVKGELEEFETKDLSVRFSGSSNFILNTISESLNIKTSGSSNITLNGTTNNFLINSTGSAKVNAYEFFANNIIVKSSGSSRLQLNVQESLDINSSGSTHISYINENDDVVVTKKISGSGEVVRHIME